MLNWQSVVSSNISEIAYDAEQSELHIKFSSGSEYVYNEVPQSVFDDFLDAPSKGRFFSATIKGSYNYTRV